MLGLQRLFVFPRFACVARPSAGAGVVGLERLHIDVPDGRVEAWLLPGRGVSHEAKGPAVVFAHGNAELIDDWPELLESYRRLGISVLLPEYRGYGRSAGEPSEAAITGDFVRFYDLLVARPEIDADRVVFHGRSIGGGVVCALARHRMPAALVLQSTFTSIADIARRWLVPSSLILDPFDNAAVIEALDVPVLIVHGRRDRLIPISHAETLARVARRGRLTTYDADHNDCPPDWGVFFRDVRAFLADAGIVARARVSAAE